jgi:signal transduction histidine kinase
MSAPHPDPATLELLPDPTVVVEADGRIAAANTLAQRLAGGEPLEGRDAATALPLTDEAGRDWWVCARPLEADVSVASRVPEVDLQLAAGERMRPVTLTATRIGGNGGGLALLVLSLRRAERRQRLDAARSDLISTVSHEIRSPLTSVKGFTRTLLAKWERFTDDQKRQMLAVVNEDADRVTRLLGELLDVSRIDAGRLRLGRELVDLGGIAREAADRVAANGAHPQVTVDLPGDLPQVYADPDKMRQVFANLLENAVTHGAEPVTVTAAVRADVVEFTVADTGPGIDPDHLAAVFTKFFRRTGERRTGTGLGLYITRGIMEAHGGSVWAERSDTGARLHFVVPRGGLELAGAELPTTRGERT